MLAPLTPRDITADTKTVVVLAGIGVRVVLPVVESAAQSTMLARSRAVWSQRGPNIAAGLHVHGG
jgi:hypothetical protein